MVLFFFYDKLSNTELIKKISESFEITDGYIVINTYDSSNNILEISNDSINNKTLLHGKIVNFNMKMEDVLSKINEIQECKFKNKTKYTMEKILANKKYGLRCICYIIY
jgi:hypothetical protein